MTPYLTGILLLPFALWIILFFHSRLLDTKPKTTAESGVRLLYSIARWWMAVAWAAEWALVQYRESALEPECEKSRRAKEEMRKAVEAVRTNEVESAPLSDFSSATLPAAAGIPGKEEARKKHKAVIPLI